MDPISAVTGIAGLIGIGTSLFGASAANKTAGQIAGYEEQIAGYQQQQNTQQQQLMTLGYQRSQIQNLRNVQQAKAAGMSAGVSQGAQYGSGVAGAQSSETAQGAWNALGASNQYQIGMNMFNLQGQIYQTQGQLAGAQSSLATDQGLMNIGNSIARAAPTIGQIGGGGIQSIFG